MTLLSHGHDIMCITSQSKLKANRCNYWNTHATTTNHSPPPALPDGGMRPSSRAGLKSEDRDELLERSPLSSWGRGTNTVTSSGGLWESQFVSALV